MPNFIGRSWSSHLAFNVKKASTRAALVVQWHRQGRIDDYQLWEILSTYGSPLSHKDAAVVYQILGFVPHMGYPLTPSRSWVWVCQRCGMKYPDTHLRCDCQH